jgi:hypothetical protein
MTAELGNLLRPSEYVYRLWYEASYGGLTRSMLRRLLLTPVQEQDLRHEWRMANYLCETCLQIAPYGYHTAFGSWHLRMHGEQAFVYFYAKPWEVTDGAVTEVPPGIDTTLGTD